ncbi:MAG: hypothetical protein OES23_05515, partial [Nitrosopumilus sp.]|nr:hypothetical protein [Nitrosopumilus sp.]
MRSLEVSNTTLDNLSNSPSSLPDAPNSREKVVAYDDIGTKAILPNNKKLKNKKNEIFLIIILYKIKLGVIKKWDQF